MRKAPPTKRQIVAAQSKLVEVLREKFETEDPIECCWGCGEKGSKNSIEKAHIVPYSAKGDDTMFADNFFLLCKSCHREQPDNAGYEAQIEWIKHQKSQDLRDLDWCFELIKELIEIAEAEVGEDLGQGLIGLWGQSLSDDPQAISKMMRGRYPKHGRGLRENMRATAAASLIYEFKYFVRELSNEALRETVKEFTA